MIKPCTALFYKDPITKREPAKEWLESLKDGMAQARVYARIARAEKGNLGDHKSVGDGVHEMRIQTGPGYRVYFAYDGTDVILLLIGGDKSTQSKDISQAKKYWLSHKLESKKGK